MAIKKDTSSTMSEKKADTTAATSQKLEDSEKTDAIKKCGIVMPISSIDDCSEKHWKEIRIILSDSIKDAGFEPNLVSETEEVSIIQKTIVENLYKNPIVVCDVSAKNPNVMFELGLRLAFDKPTIIVKDNATNYSFDTGPIEHLPYPRDLRFGEIVQFKEKLTKKIQDTYSASTKPSYSTFLKHFGDFTVPKLETREIPIDNYLLEELKNIKQSILKLERKDFHSQKLLKPAFWNNKELSSKPNDPYYEGMQTITHLKIIGSKTDLIECYNRIKTIIGVQQLLNFTLNDTFATCQVLNLSPFKKEEIQTSLRDCTVDFFWESPRRVAS